MKYFLLTLIFFCTVLASLQAQKGFFEELKKADPDPKFTINLYTGAGYMAYSFMSTETFGNSIIKLTFPISAQGQYYLSKHFALGTGLDFTFAPKLRQSWDLNICLLKYYGRMEFTTSRPKTKTRFVMGINIGSFGVWGDLGERSRLAIYSGIDAAFQYRISQRTSFVFSYLVDFSFKQNYINDELFSDIMFGNEFRIGLQLRI